MRRGRCGGKRPRRRRCGLARVAAVARQRGCGGAAARGRIVGRRRCGCEGSGTCTIVLHCGHEARLPAALAGTFSARPQPVQWNSMVSDGWAECDMLRSRMDQ